MIAARSVIAPVIVDTELLSAHKVHVKMRYGLQSVIALIDYKTEAVFKPERRRKLAYLFDACGEFRRVSVRHLIEVFITVS